MSSAGRCIARSTSSGMVVGPGIARNSRPARTTIVLFLVDGPGEGMQGNAGKFKPEGDAAKLLPPGFAAARGFGVLDRAEPARALADVHLDLRVPAAGRLVVDAFAGAVDIAPDGGVGG